MKLIRLDENQMRDYLACYGADISQWPESLQAMGRLAENQREFASLIERERRFEQQLARNIPPASPDLAERIISASGRMRIAANDAWPILQIKPAAMAAMLMIGFALGFGGMMAPNIDDEYSISYNDDDGAIL